MIERCRTNGAQGRRGRMLREYMKQKRKIGEVVTLMEEYLILDAPGISDLSQIHCRHEEVEINDGWWSCGSCGAWFESGGY